MTQQRRIVILDAPSNLGLRPPAAGAVPGCYKMPWALHDRRISAQLGAVYAGVVIPPRYLADWKPNDGDRNADAIADYSLRLATRVAQHVRPDTLLLVIGGDCSILLGNMLALRQRGRYGLVFVDAHSDYPHPGNAPAISAAAGEDLAIVTGKGDQRLINLHGLTPYVRTEDVLVLGILDSDEDIAELRADGIHVVTNSALIRDGAVETYLDALQHRTAGFWVHLDVDVVDKIEMSAVDSPERTGISFRQLAAVVKPLLGRAACVGMELTIYDPDLDPEGVQGDRIVTFLNEVFSSYR